jgi:NADPH2:quinone reductase
MKAIRIHAFGGPEVLQLDDIPSPDVGPGQILVRINAVGVNPVDTYIRAGTYGARDFPFTPGHDGAGEIVALGDGVAQQRPDLAIGKRVWVCRSLTGTYAQYALCQSPSVIALPPRLSFHEGAAVGVPYLTAYQALHQRARVRAGETVLVHGASGGVGLACVQMARSIGCIVIGTASTPDGLQLIRSEGAHQAVDHSQIGYEQSILDMTRQKGIDVVIEMLANVNLSRDLSLIAMRGRVVVVGNRGSIDFNPRLTMARDASVLGMSLMNALPEDWTAACWGVNQGLHNGTLRPIVRCVLPLADARKAHDMVMERGSKGKIILDTDAV